MEQKESSFDIDKAILKGIDEILHDLLWLNMELIFDTPQKQKGQIELLKSYFLLLIPKLSDEEIKKYEGKISKLKIKIRTSVKSGIQKIGAIYDIELESEINQYFMEFQKYAKRLYKKVYGEDSSEEVVEDEEEEVK